MKRESSAGLGDVCASGQSFSPRGPRRGQQEQGVASG